MNRGERKIMKAWPTIAASIEAHLCSSCKGTGEQECDDPQCGDSTWDHYCTAGRCKECNGTGTKAPDDSDTRPEQRGEGE